MTILATDKDQTGIVLLEKDIRTAIKHYDAKAQSVTILLGSMAIRISIHEVQELSLYLATV